MTIIRHIIRFIVSAIALLIIAWLVPGFTLTGFWNAFWAALVIALIGWGIEMLMGEGISPNARGIVGFLVSAAVIYFAQFLIPTYRATIIGSLIAAAIIGIVDRFVPIKPEIATREETNQ